LIFPKTFEAHEVLAFECNSTGRGFHADGALNVAAGKMQNAGAP
jgi:hypothetical protein